MYTGGAAPHLINSGVLFIRNINQYKKTNFLENAGFVKAIVFPRLASHLDFIMKSLFASLQMNRKAFYTSP